jgi:putative tryptophan/tyrosine transport system substrate-binding protein
MHLTGPQHAFARPSAILFDLGHHSARSSNVTGVFLDFPEFSAKCLQLLIEAIPALARVGVLWDPTTGSLQRTWVEAAAQGFGVSVQVFEARRVADIAEAFYALDRSRIQGLLMLSSPLFGGNPQLVADLAMRRNVPTISLFPDIAREGGLLAYGPDIEALYRQAAGMARKVLHGAKVAELPAERPTRFQLVANLRTAKLFGTTLPRHAHRAAERDSQGRHDPGRAHADHHRR